MTTYQEALKKAENLFTRDGFHADYRECGDVAVLDWRDRDNSNHCAIRFLFCGNLLTISGDVGYAVVELTEKATLAALSHYRNKPDYFLEKVQASTDGYVYDYEAGEDTLRKYLKTHQEDDSETDELDEDDEDDEEFFHEMMENFTLTDGFQCPKCTDLVYNHCDDAFDMLEAIMGAGKTPHIRVALWLEALHMAYLQITNTENKTTTCDVESIVKPEYEGEIYPSPFGLNPGEKFVIEEIDSKFKAK